MASVAAVAGAHLALPEPAVAAAAMSIGKTATAEPGPPETAAFSAAEAPVFEAS
jgi:hypothetical protein